MQTVRLSIRMRWWLKLYLHGVVVMAALMDAELDEDKLRWHIERGLVIKVVPVRHAIQA